MPKSPFIRDPNAPPPPPPSRQAVLDELKRRGVEIEIVSDEEKARRRAEIIRCAKDCKYFIDTYVKTIDPRETQNPFVPFVLFPKQREMIDWLDERLKTKTKGVVEKSRDTGVSWVMCAWMFHKWMFYEGFVGGLGSHKLEYVDKKGNPKSLFEKFRIIIDNLPKWMIPPGFDRKKHDLECLLINPALRSTLTGEGGDDIGRGGRSSIYFVDEYNKLEHPEMADAALRDNSHVLIYVGTPNGLIGIYEKKSVWPCFTLHWKDDPRKNRQAEDGTYPWYETQKYDYRDQPWIIKQELDIDYLGSGHPLYDRVFLMQELERTKKIVPLLVEEPENSAWSGTVKTFREPDYDARYIILADVAEGESKNTGGDPDWSVAHVYDTEDWFQCATYRSRCDTHSYAIDLAVLGEMYNWAEVCVERTGPGIAVVKALTEEIVYPCVWGEYSQSGAIKHGWMATARSKKEAESKLQSIISDMAQGFDGFQWCDPRTIEELIHYAIDENGQTKGDKGYHDDENSVCRMASLLLSQVTTRRKMIQHKPPKPQIAYGAGRGRR